MSTDTETPEQPQTLTEEQRAKMEEWLRAHPYGEQDENGVDLGALRRNLRLTPSQRIDRLQSAVNAVWEIRHGRFTQ